MKLMNSINIVYCQQYKPSNFNNILRYFQLAPISNDKSLLFTEKSSLCRYKVRLKFQLKVKLEQVIITYSGNGFDNCTCANDMLLNLE